MGRVYRPFGAASILLAAALAASCGNGSAGPAPFGGPIGPKAARLAIGYDGALAIGKLRPFAYDGRGGGGLGTLQDRRDGTADFVIPAEDVSIPPLIVVPGEDGARVEILPKDLVGTVNFCTGEVSLRFDAAFRPIIAGQARADLSVVTDLTTETSSGMSVTLIGARMDAFGVLRLVGVAVVPPTGDGAVDDLLGLPADAAASLAARIEFPEGRFECPDAPRPDPQNIRIALGGNAALDIADLPELPYDGRDAGAAGPITSRSEFEGRYRVEFDPDAFDLPALEVLPGPGGAGFYVDLTRFEGEIDRCTGEAGLLYEGTLTPYGFGRVLTAIRLIETLTTEKVETEDFSLMGERLDDFGLATLVGVAYAPATGDVNLDRRLGLPAEVALTWPVWIATDGRDPACERR